MTTPSSGYAVTTSPVMMSAFFSSTSYLWGYPLTGFGRRASRSTTDRNMNGEAVRHKLFRRSVNTRHGGTARGEVSCFHSGALRKTYRPDHGRIYVLHVPLARRLHYGLCVMIFRTTGDLTEPVFAEHCCASCALLPVAAIARRRIAGRVPLAHAAFTYGAGNRGLTHSLRLMSCWSLE
ncbi:hypothetical protein Q3H59_004246 [Pantoea sp. SORGH_AS 659]|nr:hypothetical protein [Pantoea sp. SORGH_AS_0659]